MRMLVRRAASISSSAFPMVTASRLHTKLPLAPFTFPAVPFIRQFCAAPKISNEELSRRLDEFQALFVEARLCIEDCQDAAETTCVYTQKAIMGALSMDQARTLIARCAWTCMCKCAYLHVCTRCMLCTSAYDACARLRA